MKQRALTTENQERKIVDFIQEIKSRKLCNVVTTAIVKQKWAKVYYGKKLPSKSNLHRFRTRNGLTTILNKKTGKKDIWEFKET